MTSGSCRLFIITLAEQFPTDSQSDNIMAISLLPMLLLLFGQNSAAHVHLMSSSKEVTLSCTSSSPWFFCVWEGPHGERACALRDQMDTHGNTLCGKQDRLEIRGNSSICTLVIRAPSMSDQGSWTCVVSDDKMETVKDYRQLDMVVEGDMNLLTYANMEEIVEGEMIELVCSVRDAYPVPEVSWSVPSTMAGVFNTSSQAVVSSADMSGLVSVQHTAYYMPAWQDREVNISCIATQGNITKQVRNKVIRVKKDNARYRKNEIDINTDLLTLISVIIMAIIMILVILSRLIYLRNRSRKNPCSHVDLVKHNKSGCQNEEEIKGDEKQRCETIDMNYARIFKNNSLKADIKDTSNASYSSISSCDTNDESPEMESKSLNKVELNNSPKPRVYLETHFD